MPDGEELTPYQKAKLAEAEAWLKVYEACDQLAEALGQARESVTVFRKDLLGPKQEEGGK